MSNSDWASEAFGDEAEVLTDAQLQEWIDNTFGDVEWQVRQENKRAAQSAIDFGGVKLPEVPAKDFVARHYERLALDAQELIAEHGGVLPDGCKPEKLGTYCECGAPYTQLATGRWGYRCAR